MSSPADDQWTPGIVLADRYEVRGPLDSGGMGEVYLGFDTRLQQYVALKRVVPRLRHNPEAQAALLAEARRLADISHQNIPRVLDVPLHDGERFVVMDYVEGRTLRACLRAPIAPRRTLEILIQIAEALGAAHEQGIVHCDIKPANIVLTRRDQVKVLDFGIARYFARTAVDTNTRTGDGLATELPPVSSASIDPIQGTGGYIAPEVLRDKPCDGRADLFALGVVAYECLIGEHPFEGADAHDTRDRVLLHDPPRVSTINTRVAADFERIVSKLLVKDPAGRYQSAADVVADLRAIARVVPPRPTWRYIAAAAAILFLIGGLWTLSAFRKSPMRSFSARDWVVVADVAHSAESHESDLAVTLQDALIYELEQSPHVNVYPHARVVESLARMKRPPATPVDEAVAREICRRDGLTAVVVASIRTLADRYTIDLRVVDPTSEHVAASGHEESLTRVETLAAMRRLGRQLRAQLGETVASITSTSPPLEPVTSSSFEAVQQFTLGRRLFDEGKFSAALPFFLQAIELDKEFASAYQHAAGCYDGLGDRQQLMIYLQKAVQLAAPVGPRERWNILGAYDSTLERYEQAIADYRSLLATYPDDPRARANLGRSYGQLFQFNEAIDSLSQALRVYPAQRIRGVLAWQYFKSRRIDDAVRLEQENLTETPVRPQSWIMLAEYSLAKGDLGQATHWLSETDRQGATYGARSPQIVLSKVDVALSRGKYQDALHELGPSPRAPAAVVNAGEALMHLRRAEIWINLGDVSRAVAELRRLRAAAAAPDVQIIWGVLSARARDLVDAESMEQVLKTDSAFRQSPPADARLHQLHAEIAMARGRAEDALDAARQAVRAYNSTFVLETLARAQLAAGDRATAAATYQTILNRAEERTLEIDQFAYFHVVRTHYELGRVLDDLGQSDAALKHYREVLRWWEDGDADAPALRDVRRRLGEGAHSTPAGRVPTPAA